MPHAFAFGGIADFIKGVINKIKGFFNFEWKLPKIKLPHFKASGEWSLVPPKVPKFSVDWYANGGILNSPTIFGSNGNSLMGGGEAGKEAVLPIDLLRSYIREENQGNNEVLAQMMHTVFLVYAGNESNSRSVFYLVFKEDIWTFYKHVI